MADSLEMTILAEKPLDGLRVLVLEDEFLIAMDVEELCREHGASDVAILRSFTDSDANPLAGAAAFDAAVLDVMVAGQPTFDFARQLQERCIPFVFATGHADNPSLFEAFEDVAVVGKPYSGDELVKALAAAVLARKG